jgi:hypothetical protein
MRGFNRAAISCCRRLLAGLLLRRMDRNRYPDLQGYSSLSNRIGAQQEGVQIVVADDAGAARDKLHGIRQVIRT